MANNDIRHINYKSDFSVVLEMPDGVPAWDWKLAFRVGVKEVAFEQTGGVLPQGVKKQDDTHVEVFFDNHGFGCGTLIVEFSEAVPDADYGDGYKNVHTPQVLPVVLWSRASDDTAPLGVTLQSSLDSAVANAVGKINSEVGSNTNRITALEVENKTLAEAIDALKPTVNAYTLYSYPYTPGFNNAILPCEMIVSDPDNSIIRNWIVEIPEDADVMEQATKWTAFIIVHRKNIFNTHIRLNMSLNDMQGNHKLLITADETTKKYLSGNTLTFDTGSKTQVFRVDCMAAMNVVSLDWHWLGEIKS